MGQNSEVPVIVFQVWHDDGAVYFPTRPEADEYAELLATHRGEPVEVEPFLIRSDLPLATLACSLLMGMGWSRAGPRPKHEVLPAGELTSFAPTLARAEIEPGKAPWKLLVQDLGEPIH